MTDFTPAKCGDIVVIPRWFSITYASGTGRGTERQVEWNLGIVSSVTRKGRVKAADAIAPNGVRYPRYFRNPAECSVLAAERLATDPVTILTQLDGVFTSLDEVRDRLRPFVIHPRRKNRGAQRKPPQ